MKNFAYILLWFIVLAVIAGALLFFEGDLLWKVQEQNLFLASSLFFHEQMVVPGGFLTWVSTFFTQFLFWPWMGVLLLCGWWWLLMWLTKRAFHIPDLWTGLLLIPVALLLLTIADMGYWVYMLKLQGHFFVATIGTTVLVLLLWVFRCLPDRYYLRVAFPFLVCAVGYPLFGIYGLAASLLMAVWSWRLKAHAIACTGVALLSIVAVPLVCYRFVYYQTNLANIYYAELPLYYVTERYQAYYAPFWLLLLFFLALAVIPLKQPVVAASRTSKQAGDNKSATMKIVVVQAVILAIVAAGIIHFWFKDENFHRELAMQHHIEQLDWEGVLQEAKLQQDEPTRAIVMMKNLALGRLGRQGNEMFLYKNGAKKYNAPFNMPSMLVVGPLAYYHYGMINYCARLSTEMGVEFGWRAENLKLLSKCAILQRSDRERQHALKYLNILKQTSTFGDWAEAILPLAGDSAAIASDPELGWILRMMHYDDDLTTDQGNVERFIMNSLANSTYTGDPLFQEQALLATLWTKDTGQFWRRFSDYIRLHPDGPMPRYYQEAALLYANIEGRESYQQMPVDKGVRDTFLRFQEVAAPYDNGDVEVARQGLSFLFGQTYYYEYYLMSQLPEY